MSEKFGGWEFTNLKKNNGEFSFDYKAPEKIDVEVSSYLSQLKTEINETITLPVRDVDWTEKVISVPTEALDWNNNKQPVFTWQAVSGPLEYFNEEKHKIDWDRNWNWTNIDEILSSIERKWKIIYDDIMILELFTKQTIDWKNWLDEKWNQILVESDEKIKFSFFYLKMKIKEKINTEKWLSYKEFIKIFEDNLDGLWVLKNWKELIAPAKYIKPDWINNKKEVYKTDEIIKSKK